MHPLVLSLYTESLDAFEIIMIRSHPYVAFVLFLINSTLISSLLFADPPYSIVALVLVQPKPNPVNKLCLVFPPSIIIAVSLTLLLLNWHDGGERLNIFPLIVGSPLFHIT